MYVLYDAEEYDVLNGAEVEVLNGNVILLWTEDGTDYQLTWQTY